MDGEPTRTRPGRSTDSTTADAAHAPGGTGSPRIPPLELFRRPEGVDRTQVRIASVVGCSPEMIASVEPAGGRAREAELSAEPLDAYGVLRGQIMNGVHLGYLRTGDRLPSIRAIAREFGISHHTAVRTYRQLEGDGLVEKRGRSGIFVANLASSRSHPLVETGSWIAEVLGDACEHQIRIPWLPELIRRWTMTFRISCACIESDEDSLRALCLEFSTRLGVECEPVMADQLAPASGEGAERDLPARVREADVLITTTFHAPRVRAIAESLGIPLVIAKADPQIVDAIDRHLASAPLTLVCLDPLFGERIRSMRSPAQRQGIRVMLVQDAARIAELDRAEPILLTRAARERLGNLNVRLLTPHFPGFSLESARELATLMVQLNIDAERRQAVPSLL